MNRRRATGSWSTAARCSTASRSTGCTYFITFRLGDSLPQAKLRQWREERGLWLRVRGLSSPDQLSRLPLAEQRQFSRHFSRQMHEWLDAGYGSCLLRETRFTRIVSDALLFFDRERCAMGDFVVMPNHVHLLATPFEAWTPTSLLHSVKRHSAREMNKLRGVRGALWLDESFDHVVRSSEQLAFFRAYIRENPSKARLREGDYVLGCGSDRERGTGL